MLEFNSKLFGHTFCLQVYEPLDLHVHQGNTTNLNISFSIEYEERAAQVGLEPTTYCLLGRCSTTKLPRQLNGWPLGRIKAIQGTGNQSNLT